MDKEFRLQVDEVAEILLKDYESGIIDLKVIRARRRYFADIASSDEIVGIVRRRAQLQYWGAKTAMDRIASSTQK